MIKFGGAQIPVGINIQSNKKEILKAIDWAKENEVDHLLTPEAALSGWDREWITHIDEIKDALKEIEDAQKAAGIYLHLGTNFVEPEEKGIINRNEIRHYDSDGILRGATYKTLCVDMETALGRDPQVDSFTIIDLVKDDEKQCLGAGLICNDMWGYAEASTKPITTLYKELGILDVILHATNGGKTDPSNPSWLVFEKWHDAYLRMAAWNCMVPIFTVDACTDWLWDGNEDEVDKYTTSSESGWIDSQGWQTQVPRRGRQYFTYDFEPPVRTKLSDVYNDIGGRLYQK